MSTTRALGSLTAVLLLTPALLACSGDDAPTAEELSPTEVLAEAKELFDATSGVRLNLSTSGLPQGVGGITEADGVATSAPAFEGTITVVYVGQNVEVPVVAVDGDVHVQMPFTTAWSTIDPGDYGAPDPAGLMDPQTGLSSLLTATTEAEEGDSVRGGTNNREVLTPYTGTVPGDVVKNVIPSASGDFDATYTISDDGELREAVLEGVFYPDTPVMTYTLAFSDYGTTQEITAP